jgi:hypothetical protein
MKTQNELFKAFLNENINEIKDVLVDTFELDEDGVNEIVKFKGNSRKGYYGVNKDGDCVTFGCDIFEKVNKKDEDDEDVSIGMDVIGGKEVYFVCYDF